MKYRFFSAVTFAWPFVSLAPVGALGCAHVSIETVDPPDADLDATPVDGNARLNACIDCPECQAQRAACLELPLCRAASDCTTARNCYTVPLREFFDCASKCATEVGITSFDDPAAVTGYAHYQCLLNSSCRVACIGDQ